MTDAPGQERGWIMTERLFEKDPYMAEFTAVIRSCCPEKEGFAVTLDRTAFYPGGGGQPCDLGQLGSQTVTEVLERDGQILHRCREALPVGQTVTGKIDWARRFDLMQQHTGEHLLSGICHRLYGCENVGFHMGKDFITIDLDRVLTEEQVAAAEQAVNAAIWQNLPVTVRYPDEAARMQILYRSKKELSGQVRLVEVPGVDICACCGTHVHFTGAVGLLRVFSCVRFRQGVRLELLCGGRCLEYLTGMQEQNRRISGLLSAKPPQTAQAVERLLGELGDRKLRLAALEEAAMEQEAAAYAGKGDCVVFRQTMESAQVRRLCDRVRTACGGRCIVFAGTDGGYQYAAAGGAGDLRELAKALGSQLGGRGGGKPDFVQGSVAATQQAIEEFLAL